MPGPGDDDWEYEYDTQDTEVFLVDLDLSTVNQSVKYTGANKLKRLNEIAGTAASKKRKIADKPDNNNETAAHNGRDGSAVGPDTPVAGQVDDHDQENNSQMKGIQIIDLNGGNPIVAYGGEVFSCKWTDMIGTSMFFTQPRETPLYDAEISTANYELIGTSRLKLVGTKAKVTPVQQQALNAAKPVPSGQSLGTIRRTNAKVNADIRKQASFLEQLMNIKKDRGETDNVFVAMNDNIAAAVSARRSRISLRNHAQKIEALNWQAVKGSADALEQIEQLYLDQQDNVVDEDPRSPSAAQPGDDSDAEYEIDHQPQASLATRPPTMSTHPDSRTPSSNANPNTNNGV